MTASLLPRLDEHAIALLKVIAAYERARTEMRRCQQAGDPQPRAQKAGGRLIVARARMFAEAKRINEL